MPKWTAVWLVVAFFSGCALATAAYFVYFQGIQSEHWLVLAPFLLLSTGFSVLATLFVLEARRDLLEHQSRMKSELGTALEQSQARFEQGLSAANRHLADGVAGVAREGQSIRTELTRAVEQTEADFGRQLDAAAGRLSRDIDRLTAEGRRIGNDLGTALTQTEAHFSRSLQEAYDRLTAGIANISKESEIVFEENFNTDGEHSACYDRLIQLVEGAHESLVVIPNPYVRSSSTQKEHRMRERYHRAIERKLFQVQRDGRRLGYTRIQQIAPGASDLREHMSPIEWEHLQRVADMEYADAQLMVIDNTGITGQLIIDEQTFVNLITAVDSLGRKRMVAISVQKDPDSDGVKRYATMLLAMLQAKARLISDVQAKPVYAPPAGDLRGADVAAAGPSEDARVPAPSSTDTPGEGVAH